MKTPTPEDFIDKTLEIVYDNYGYILYLLAITLIGIIIAIFSTEAIKEKKRMELYEKCITAKDVKQSNVRRI